MCDFSMRNNVRKTSTRDTATEGDMKILKQIKGTFFTPATLFSFFQHISNTVTSFKTELSKCTIRGELIVGSMLRVMSPHMRERSWGNEPKEKKEVRLCIQRHISKTQMTGTERNGTR